MASSGDSAAPRPGFRKDKDALGYVEVPEEALYGAQTRRSMLNFPICAGKDTMPIRLVHALALIKQTAAQINRKRETIPQNIGDAIISAAEEVQAGKHDVHFPLVVWQTGSGTQSNMNMNEVIANRANEILGGKRGDKSLCHPNDHVNRGQSSNDIFPTAMNVSACLETAYRLLPSLDYLIEHLKEKRDKYMKLVKIGRTHMQDAVPLTVGQELSGYVAQLENCVEGLERQLPFAARLAVGGTAVGTGLNSVPKFDEQFCDALTELSAKKYHTDKVKECRKVRFMPDTNKFAALAGHDQLLLLSGAINATAAALLKLANDLRLLASGPRCGLGEYVLPSNEPGSSIMPGKINPTQCEAMSMVCVQVMGNHLTTGLAGSQGHLELNVYKPVLAYNLLHSIELLGDASRCFADNCVKGLTMNEDKIAENMRNSLMLVTALNPVIGYDKAAECALYAHSKKLSLLEAVLEKGYLDEKQFNEAIQPLKMAFPFGEPK